MSAITVTRTRTCLDSPAAANGVKVTTRTSPKGVVSPDGWLHVEIEADDSIIGFAVTFNGRDVPVAASVSATTEEPEVIFSIELNETDRARRAEEDRRRRS